MPGQAQRYDTTVLRFLAEHGPTPLGEFRHRRHAISQSGGLAAAKRCIAAGYAYQDRQGRVDLTVRGRMELDRQAAERAEEKA